MNPVEEDRALDGENASFGDERRGRAAMDPTTRHLALIAGGIGVLLAVLIGGWMLSGRHPGSIPVIEAPAGPVRLKPVDAGGMQAMGAQAPPAVSGKGGETLSSQPEVARPDALQAEVDAARRDGGAGQPPPATAPAAPADRVPPSASSPSVKPKPQQMLQPVPPHAPAEHRPGTRPDSLLRTDMSPEPAGQPAIQLAAVGSDVAAQTEWDRLRRDHPTLFSGHTPEVEQADHAGRSIYRLRMRGFGSIAAATSFCAQAHAQGVACTLADF